jgi:hypothetical protein
MAIKNRITPFVRDSNAWASWAERIWRVAGVFGIHGWITAVAGAALASSLAAILYVLKATPWYVLLVVSVLFAATVLHLWNQLRIAWSLRGVRKLDIGELAEECCTYYRDFADFMVSRHDARPLGGLNPGDADFHRQWQERVNLSQRTDALMMQRFGPRVFAITQQLKNLGIPTPNLFHFSSGDTGGASVYIGTVGELLKNGLLEEARKLDPKVTWGATFR